MTISLMLPLVGKTQTDLQRVDKGTGSLTFIRATTATRVNPDTGLIESLASGDLREDGRTYKNLFTSSEDMTGAGWSKQRCNVIPNSALAPNGRTAANLIYPTENNSNTDAYSFMTLRAGQFTLSFYVKAAGKSWVGVYCNGGNSQFDLANGVAGTIHANHTATFTSVGDGWYRITITTSYTGGMGYWQVGPRDGDSINSTISGNDGVYVWGAQLEPGATAGRYVKTGTTQGFAPKGVLIEGQRTNLMTYSENFTAGPYGGVGRTITANNTTAPDGNATADLFLEAVDVNGHYIMQNYVYSAGAYTASVWIKPNGRDWIQMWIYDGTTTHLAYFNVTTGQIGTVGAGVTARIEGPINGFYRCSLSATTSAGAGQVYILGALADNGPYYYTEDVTKGYWLWGLQLESGAFPSSYIPTTSAAVTRNTDVLTFVSSGNVSDTVGSIAIEMNCPSFGGPYQRHLVSENKLYLDSAGGAAYIYDGVNYPYTSALVAGESAKLSSRWGNGSLGITKDGAAVRVTSFDGSLLSSDPTTYVGKNASSELLWGNLKHLLIFNRVLTDAEMIAITS